MHHPNPTRLQELLDEALPTGETRVLHAHLESCAACARDFAGLASAAAAAAFADAPVPRLSASFNKKVLAALRPAPWAAYAAGCAGALCATWTAGLAYALFAYGRLTWAGVAASGEALSSAAGRAAVLALKLPLPEMLSLLARRASVSALPLQLCAATLIAVSFIIALGRPQAAGARRLK